MTNTLTSTPVKLLLFGSSYTPLWVIFIFLYWGEGMLWGVILCLILFLLCFAAFLYYFLVRVPSRSAFTQTLTSVQRRDGDTLGYIATYVIPFVSVPMGSNWQVDIAQWFLLVVIAIVYVSSSMIAVNPLLSIMSYHLYEVSFAGSSTTYLLLSKGSVESGKELSIVDVSDDIYLHKGAWGTWP